MPQCPQLYPLTAQESTTESLPGSMLNQCWGRASHTSLSGTPQVAGGGKAIAQNNQGPQCQHQGPWWVQRTRGCHLVKEPRSSPTTLHTDPGSNLAKGGKRCNAGCQGRPGQRNVSVHRAGSGEWEGQRPLSLSIVVTTIPSLPSASKGFTEFPPLAREAQSMDAGAVSGPRRLLCWGGESCQRLTAGTWL